MTDKNQKENSAESQETTTTPSAQSTPAEQPQVPTPQVPKADNSKANREAAKYRVELRKAEKERDEALAQLAAARRSILLSCEAMTQVEPTAREDLISEFDAETSAEFWHDDGTPNSDAITAAITAELERKPYMKKRAVMNPGIKNLIKGQNGLGHYRPHTDKLKTAISGR